jgi:aspartate 1-decarboxylase
MFARHSMHARKVSKNKNGHIIETYILKGKEGRKKKERKKH